MICESKASRPLIEWDSRKSSTRVPRKVASKQSLKDLASYRRALRDCCFLKFMLQERNEKRFQSEYTRGCKRHRQAFSWCCADTNQRKTLHSMMESQLESYSTKQLSRDECLSTGDASHSQIMSLSVCSEKDLFMRHTLVIFFSVLLWSCLSDRKGCCWRGSSRDANWNHSLCALTSRMPTLWQARDSTSFD